jgi:predicted amidohydrolase YtcJ
MSLNTQGDCGRVYTVDPERPWTEALAVAGDRFLAVGSTAEVRRLATPRPRTIDLGGAFVVPGFNDAHVHVDPTGALLVGVSLLDVHEEGAFVERVRQAAGRLPKGSWIVRGDWGAYERWGSGSAGAGRGRQEGDGAPFTPDRRMIDAVTSEHPVSVNRFDRSTYLANGLALERAGNHWADARPALEARSARIAADG